MRRLIIALVVFAAAAIAIFTYLGLRKTGSPYPEPGSVIIVRDAYGVPHVYAANTEDLAYGFGYACAEDRAVQIFTTAMRAAGRLAEIEGESALASDAMARRFRLRAIAEERLGELSPELRNLIGAYCAGVNDYASSCRQRLPEWIGELEPADVVAISLMVNFDFSMTFNVNSPWADLLRSGVGSNQFAVAPERSARGHALLSIDPHLPFDGTYRWTEAHLSTPEFSVAGAVIPGLPIICLGHNNRVAWSLTVNYPDLADIYAEEINPENPGQYRDAGGWREFATWEETIRIRNEDSIRELVLTMKSTRHGPVLAERDGVAYAARLAAHGEAGMIGQFLEIMRADSVAELLEAFRRPGIAMFNVVAADVEGNIGYLYNARCPRRNPELDWSRAVPGADLRAEWQGYIPFEELPTLLNPAGGWLQNCNDSPWYAAGGGSGGIDAERLPFRLCTRDFFGTRGRRLSELLAADESVTLDDMIAYANDTMVLEARTWMPRLLAVYDQYAEQLALQGTAAQRAAELLRGWDYRADPDSRAMALFAAWYVRAGLRRLSGDDASTGESAQRLLLELGAAASELEHRFGRIDVPWGRLLHMRHGEVEVSLPGGGIFQVLRAAYADSDESGRFPVRQGSSYMMVVEMSDPPLARSIMPFGISGDPDSPHFADLTILYSRRVYKPAWFTREEVGRHAESTIVLEIPGR